jgi:tRNA A22 N-methylase
MKTFGRARRELLARLVPDGKPWLVDVGADHGHVAHAVGAIATERRPHRRGRGDVPWVVADGLAPFRDVPVAIIAGMGALRILGILDRAPKPACLIAHAPDDPPTLREGLAERGWRIEAEALAPEGNRWAEVVRARPGHEVATGLPLAFGPRLLESGDDPYLLDHLDHTARHYERIARDTLGKAPEVHAHATERARFLRDALSRLRAPRGALVNPTPR